MCEGESEVLPAWTSIAPPVAPVAPWNSGGILWEQQKPLSWLCSLFFVQACASLLNLKNNELDLQRPLLWTADLTMHAVLKTNERFKPSLFCILLLFSVNIFRYFIMKKIGWCLIKISIKDWSKIWTIQGVFRFWFVHTFYYQ